MYVGLNIHATRKQDLRVMLGTYCFDHELIVTESDWWQKWWFIYYWCHKCIQDNAYEYKVSPMGFEFVQVCWSIEWWVGSCLPTADTVLNKLIFHNHPPLFIYIIIYINTFNLLFTHLWFFFSVPSSLLHIFFAFVGRVDMDILLLTNLWIFPMSDFFLIPSLPTFSVFFVVL